MRRHLRIALAALGPGFAAGPVAAADPVGEPTVNLDDPQVIRSGRTDFARNCAVGYCHGKEGRPNRGPRLRGRRLERDYLFRVIRDGIPRSSMRGWKQTLTDSQIWGLVAYIEVLAPLGPGDPDPYAAAATTVADPAPADVVASPVIEDPTAGNLVGDPAAGEQLFFDGSRDFYCGACHQVAGVGGLVGPDLTSLGERSPRAIFIDTIMPGSYVAPGGELHRLTTVGGAELDVIPAGETRTRIKVYNVGSFPPVLRSFRRDQVREVRPLARSGMPSIYVERYTLKQLLDLVAFLASSGSNRSEPLRLRDIL